MVSSQESMGKNIKIFRGIAGIFLIGAIGYVLLEGNDEMKDSTLSNTQPYVGGQCNYKNYKGTAKIVAIIKKNGAQSGYALKFLFTPDEQIEESFAQKQIGLEITMISKSSYSVDVLDH
jgi:hypothetical protein